MEDYIFDLNAFIINSYYVILKKTVESLIIEYVGVLIRYNLIDKATVVHSFVGS